MLKSDRIELTFLKLIIDFGEPAGRMIVLPNLMSHFEEQVGPVKVQEIVEVVMVLAEKRLVSIGKYRGQDLIPRQSTDGEPYFYQNFMAKALPGARRRIEELSVHVRGGIFISHIASEKAVAIKLKELLASALKPAPEIFVSSDYVSISGGEEWYPSIMKALKKAEAVIALLSPDSVDRRWIYFEAGIAVGQDSLVLPVVWHGLAKSDIGLPLSQLQARELTDILDMNALCRELAARLHLEADTAPVPAFVQAASAEIKQKRKGSVHFA